MSSLWSKQNGGCEKKLLTPVTTQFFTLRFSNFTLHHVFSPLKFPARKSFIDSSVFWKHLIEKLERSNEDSVGLCVCRAVIKPREKSSVKKKRVVLILPESLPPPHEPLPPSSWRFIFFPSSSSPSLIHQVFYLKSFPKWRWEFLAEGFLFKIHVI